MIDKLNLATFIGLWDAFLVGQITLNTQMAFSHICVWQMQP